MSRTMDVARYLGRAESEIVKAGSMGSLAEVAQFLGESQVGLGRAAAKFPAPPPEEPEGAAEPAADPPAEGSA